MKNKKSPWIWIPTLYFAEGIPYVVIATSVLALMYHSFGLSNTQNTFLTSWLYLPWVIKPLWSPFVDMFSTKRRWILTMQLILGIGFALVAFVLPTTIYFQTSLALFWFMAFASATHDISADGYYMLELEDRQQSLFVGIRSLFYKLATIFGEGFLVIIAGYFEKTTKNIPLSWSIAFFTLSGIFFTIFVYHCFYLPKTETDTSNTNISTKEALTNFFNTFILFFRKKNIITALSFILLYRISEALLIKISPLFLKDTIASGGLNLSTIEIGVIRNTVGVIALTVGGILGGVAISRKGLKYWLMPMAMCITIPNLVYVYLAYYQPSNLIIINSTVALEQFGYGFGFTSYMMYLIRFVDGEHKTSHYAICTGFMALGMMLPGMIAGWLQELLGSYLNFFLFVVLLTVLTIAVIPFVDNTIKNE